MHIQAKSMQPVCINGLPRTGTCSFLSHAAGTRCCKLYLLHNKTVRHRAATYRPGQICCSALCATCCLAWPQSSQKAWIDTSRICRTRSVMHDTPHAGRMMTFNNRAVAAKRTTSSAKCATRTARSSCHFNSSIELYRIHQRLYSKHVQHVQHAQQ